MQEFEGIQIPDTASDWELYSSEPGAAKAARDLTAALKRSIRAIPKFIAEDMCKTHPVGEDHGMAKQLAKAAAMPRGINEAMDKHAKLGATDTEPRGHRTQALIDWAKLKMFGTTEGYHPEFGDWL
jgi:hypothetical protein